MPVFGGGGVGGGGGFLALGVCVSFPPGEKAR